jgi:hypothetical protein
MEWGHLKIFSSRNHRARRAHLYESFLIYRDHGNVDSHGPRRSGGATIRDHARNFSRRVLGLVVSEKLESQENIMSPRKI